MTRTLLLVAAIVLLAGSIGFFHIQFSRMQRRRALLASGFLFGFGLFMVGASLAAQTW